MPKAPMMRLRMVMEYVNERVFCVMIRVFVRSSSGASFWTVDRSRSEVQLMWGAMVTNHCWKGAVAVFTRIPVVIMRRLMSWYGLFG